MPKSPRFMIVTAMKNEGPYILEWVAHHLALGFDHFFVVTNDCDDGTDRILDRLAVLGHVTHVPNPKSLMRGRGQWQVMALRYAKLFNIYRDAEWIMHSDVDEFLQVNTPSKTLEAFLDEVGETDVVSFTSVPYNSAGRTKLIDEPVVSQFTQCNKPYVAERAKGTAMQPAAPVLNAVKTIYRNDVRFQLRRNHRPLLDTFSQTGRIWRDGSGHVLGADYTDSKTKALDALSTVDHAQLNHYAIRSAEAYLLKVDRGDVAGTTRLEQSLKYWNAYNQAGDDDTRYAEPTKACRKILNSLLQDSELKPLHDEAVEVHGQKVTRILKTEAGRELARKIGYGD